MAGPHGMSGDLLQRRGRVAFLVLSGAPLSAVATQLDVSRRTVGRDVVAVIDALSGGRDSNRAACEETLREVERIGRVKSIDAARVQTLRAMATALDLDPFNAQMWREYGEALERLTSDADDAGAVADNVRVLFGSVRDPQAS